jgi:hypothetical protein
MVRGRKHTPEQIVNLLRQIGKRGFLAVFTDGGYV